MNKFRIFSILTLIGLMLITTAPRIGASSVKVEDVNLQSCIDDTLKEQQIGASNATALKRLDCSAKNISSLEGIEQLVNLEYLYLNNNSISDIDQLEYLENLKYLQLYSNDIDSVDAISSLTDLRQLLIDDNNITDISSLGSLDKLMVLSANDNKVTSIDCLENLINLRELNLVNNKIKNISSLKNLTSLQKLRLENNQIVNVDALDNLNNLQVIYLSNNQIDSLESLTSLSAVTELFVDNNELTNLVGIENMENLVSMRASGNQITEIADLSKLTKLKNIELSANQISDVSPLVKLTNIAHIYINENAITDLSSLQNMSSLKTISAREQYIALNPITVTNKEPFEYVIANIDGTNYPVSLVITKKGKDRLTNNWNVNSDGKYFSGSIIQEVNYKTQSKLSGKSKAYVGERNIRSDAQLIELFEVENNKGKTITVDQSKVDYNTIGTYPVVFMDSDLNVITAKLVVADTLPKINVESRSIDVIIGQQIKDYANVYGAVATEVTSGDLQQQLQVDASKVNYNREGKYPIVFTVFDAQGNQISTQVELNISRYKFSITNPAGARLRIYKMSRFGKGLPGYEYTIYDDDGNIVEVIVTDADGFAESAVLYPGDYYIEQTGSPNREEVIDNYLSITEMIKIININDVSSDKEKNHTILDVNISSNNGEIVGHVGVYLIAEDGTLVDYSVSDELGNVHFENVAIGTYHLILDNVSDASFTVVEEQSIEVTADGEKHQFDLVVKENSNKVIIVSLIVLLICLIIAAIRHFTKK